MSEKEKLEYYKKKLEEAKEKNDEKAIAHWAKVVYNNTLLNAPNTNITNQSDTKKRR